MRYRLLSALSLLLIIVCGLPIAGRCGQWEIIDHRTEKEGLFDNTVNALSPAGDTGVFIASGGGLHVLSDYFFLPIFQTIPTTALTQDPDGDLWAATDTGLVYRITDRDGIWTAARFPFARDKKITAIAARFNAVTIGTDSGLYYCNPDGTPHTVLKGASFTALSAPSDGTIIAGALDRTHKKGGLVIIGGTFASRTGWVEELSGNAVGALYVDADRLLIGTDAAGAFVLDDTGIHAIELPERPGRITAFLVYNTTTLVGSDTGIYASTGGGAFESISTGGGVAPAGVTSFAPGPDGSLWVGTKKDGVYLMRVHP
ncbi:MAG: hypothetical protein JW765_11060 [Deltaproteobacteria bacterium]|nr:hypothetical protein [Candidatus Zymogenaceae bacterium]